jgi:hypothetical protein
MEGLVAPPTNGAGRPLSICCRHRPAAPVRPGAILRRSPYDAAAWWCRYIFPVGGVLLDPFCGSGTMLQAGLDQGALRVVGIEKDARYIEIAHRRICDR